MIITKFYGGIMNLTKHEKILRTVQRSDGGFTYEYILSLGESTATSSFRIPLYSITVRLTAPDGTVTERASHELFSDLSHALEFFDKISLALVTPINLPYVIEDELK